MSTVTHISHPLSTPYKIWAHLPQNHDWGISGYVPVHIIHTIEEAIVCVETLQDDLIKNCMLFVMKQQVLPIYEVPQNEHGGCFSYKIPNKLVCHTWRGLIYALIGGTISTDPTFNASITGITISPKKNFCIIKIWLTDCKFQNPAMVTVSGIPGLTSRGCLFKKHIS